MSKAPTYTGRVFNIVDPSEGAITLQDIAASLSKQCRFNGHTSKFYSVAQHSILVADQLPDQLKAYGLFHDAHEAYLGDLISPLKDILLAKGFRWSELEDKIDSVIFAKYGLQWPMPPDVAKAVNHADMVALATEKRDLLPPADWWGENLPAPLPDRSVINTWEPKKAEAVFLATARQTLLP